MALTNAERQQRYRARRSAQEPRIHYRRPRDRRSRPQLWAEAVETLQGLQEEYQEWRENLPWNLNVSALAEKLDAVCAVDLSALDIELPQGFGRD